MLLLALSLFFAEPVPLEMPRAEAYLVRDDGGLRLEDRYDVLDLWTSSAVDGRWIDDDDRVLLTATFTDCPPPDASSDERSKLTRCDYSRQVREMKDDDEQSLKGAISMLSPVPLADKGDRADHMPKGFRDLVYWQGTNTSAIVCAYRAKTRWGRKHPWKLVCWTLADGDDFDERQEQFERDFLRKLEVDDEAKPASNVFAGPSAERERLRAAAKHSVAAYDNWHATDSDEFVVLDDLAFGRSAVVALTNEFKTMRARYAKTVPTGMDGSNVLAVARIFASRDEYLDALATDGLTNLSWTAAYWSQARRELVAYLPESGVKTLLSTVRHEAFHQYLAYATSMISVSPWLNEGYAQYFEGDGRVDDSDGFWTANSVEQGAAVLPSVLAMDYSGFYSGTDRERHIKYRIAQSIAAFVERGAPHVRFAPFANLKRDYFKALFDTKDMTKATAMAFGSKEKVELFVAEWKKYMTEGRFKTDDSK